MKLKEKRMKRTKRIRKERTAGKTMQDGLKPEEDETVAENPENRK